MLLHNYITKSQKHFLLNNCEISLSVYCLKIMINSLPRDELATGQNEAAPPLSTTKEDVLITPV